MSTSPLSLPSDELLSSEDRECMDGLLEPYLNNLFKLPTANIKSAFDLIMGLIKAQSTEISGLKAAQLEYTQRENEVRIHLEREYQTAVSEWESERNEITKTLHLLKEDHNYASRTQEKADALIKELKDEVKMRIESLSGNRFLDLQVATLYLNTCTDSRF